MKSKNEAVNIDKVGQVAILNNDDNAFTSLTDFSIVDKILSFYEELKDDQETKVLLIMNEKGGYGIDAYETFLEKAENDYRKNELIQAIEINMIRRFILKLLDLDKIVVFGLAGTVVTPFFGMSLSGNFRFGCEDMEFLVNHQKYGSHPTGALPFFLPYYVNQAVVSDLMYRGGKLSAQEAKDLGIITELFKKDDFKDRCVEEAKRMCAIDYDVLKKTKRLSQYIVKELEDYFRIELKMIEA
mgnify:CR=1 FL=1